MFGSSGSELHSGVPVEQWRGSGGAVVPPTQVGGRTRGLSVQTCIIQKTIPKMGSEFKKRGLFIVSFPKTGEDSVCQAGGVSDPLVKDFSRESWLGKNASLF